MIDNLPEEFDTCPKCDKRWSWSAEGLEAYTGRCDCEAVAQLWCMTLQRDPTHKGWWLFPYGAPHGEEFVGCPLPHGWTPCGQQQ
jgi:hypothetical protein